MDKSNYIDKTNGTKPFLDFHLKRNYELPLVFNTNIYNNINEKLSKNIILKPEVIKAIIGRVIVDYKPKINKPSLSEIYRILGYIQFGKISRITKYGIENDYGIFDINRGLIILFLHSEETIEDYFPHGEKNNYKLKVIPYFENGVEKLSLQKEVLNQDIIIDLNYLKKIYSSHINNLEEGFSLSQKICSIITDP